MDLDQFMELVTEALWSAAEEQGVELSTRTYEEAGILTSNAGLVVTVGDQGAQYQVTVVRSR